MDCEARKDCQALLPKLPDMGLLEGEEGSATSPD